MYCFLCPLALVDVGFTTSVVPPQLAILCNPVLSLELVGAWCSCVHRWLWAQLSASPRR